MKRKILTLSAVLLLLTGCSGDGGSSSSVPLTAWEAAAERTDIPKKETERSAAVQSTTITTTTTATATTATAFVTASAAASVIQSSSLLSSPEDIDLREGDGEGQYVFDYDGEEYSAVYTTDNWRITDSYRITDKEDITMICRALIDIHPIPTRDRNSFRTAESLAFEWQEHNNAYTMLPDDSEWKDNVKDVDLDPDDEGKSLLDMAFDRINTQKESVK